MMNVSLTPELEKYIQKQVASERYQTASEVVRHAIRLMQQGEAYERAELAALRQEVQAGVEGADRGEYIRIKNEKDVQDLYGRITQGGRARLAARKGRRPT